MTAFSWIGQTLDDLRQRDLLRTMRRMDGPAGPRVRCAGRDLLNLSSNNYLDLAGHPRIRQAVTDAVSRWGWGAGASQLVSGYTEAHDALCNDLATFEHAEDAVLFPTGYQANVGTITSLVSAKDTVLLDKLCHASIIDGARLSGATMRVFPHRDMKKLTRLLKKPTSGRRLIVTDTVFSMDGDVAPLAELIDLAIRHDAFLLLDEAHATGVLGPTGRGLAETVETPLPETVLRIGTLSKALGGLGGFVGGTRAVCDLLRNRARSLIYTTSLPPAAAEAGREALRLVEDESWRRTQVLERASHLRTLLREAQIPMIDGPAAIVPVLVGDEGATLALSKHLLEADILAPAIRPPTVPPGTSRLRLSLMATHEPEAIEHVADLLKQHVPR